MKKLFILSSFLLLCLAARTQSIDDVQAYYKADGTRFLALLNDKSIWWYMDGDSWKKVATTGLPGNTAIKSLDVYIKNSGLIADTRLIVVMDDNSMWWYKEGEKWEQVPSQGLPEGKPIKIFESYVKTVMGISESRYAVILDDNSIYWYSPGDNWAKVPPKGLPSGFNVKFFKSYVKYGMMGSTEARYVVILDDNSIWWYADGNDWEKLESKGLPAGQDITQFDTYLKMKVAGMPEARLVTVLADQSIWWLAVGAKDWEKIDVKGLPSGYKIKSFKVYQKYAGIPQTRLLALLDDNTMWWYDDKQGWTAVPTTGLLTKK
ncbi:MAG TPA: hypothetical protein VE978_23305 [Chitinophagales bacterium]|nr:hypothetical protein [Chitinophagales bacterium]